MLVPSDLGMTDGFGLTGCFTMLTTHDREVTIMDEDRPDDARAPARRPVPDAEVGGAGRFERVAQGRAPGRYRRR